MLVVKVEVWPNGDDRRAFEISRIGIVNISQLQQFSDYEVTALLSRDLEEEVVKTEIRQHDREVGWLPLVRRVISNLFLRDEMTSGVSYDDPVAQLLRKGSHVAR